MPSANPPVNPACLGSRRRKPPCLPICTSNPSPVASRLPGSLLHRPLLAPPRGASLGLRTLGPKHLRLPPRRGDWRKQTQVHRTSRQTERAHSLLRQSDCHCGHNTLPGDFHPPTQRVEPSDFSKANLYILCKVYNQTNFCARWRD